MLSANLPDQRRPRSGTAWAGLTLAALLILSASLAGCASFDPARISINVNPDQLTSIGW